MSRIGFNLLTASAFLVCAAAPLFAQSSIPDAKTVPIRAPIPVPIPAPLAAPNPPLELTDRTAGPALGAQSVGARYIAPDTTRRRAPRRRPQQVDCKLRAGTMGVMGAIGGYMLGVFPDGGTPTSKQRGAAVGFVFGVLVALGTQQNCAT